MSSSKIIVGADGSEPSMRAVQWCATYAGPLDAEVIAVHVLDAVVYIGDSNLPMPPLSPAQRGDIQDLVTREWCKPLADAGIPHRVLLMDGSPAFAIMQAAQTDNADLVVTGRRGRGGFAALLLGSTSNQLTHHLDRPLVIVP
jgi:nucleotide-binding universal stress UspA family protein